MQVNMPKMKDVMSHESERDQVHAMGWNDCLAEMKAAQAPTSNEKTDNTATLYHALERIEELERELAAAQAPASGEVEPVAFRAISEDGVFYAGTEQGAVDEALAYGLSVDSTDELYTAPPASGEAVPIVWINPVNIRRTMIAAPGETVEVSAYREGEFTAPLYAAPSASGEAVEQAMLVLDGIDSDGRCTRSEYRQIEKAIEAATPKSAVPEPFMLNGQYQTLAGDTVRFVKIHNAGTTYETMEDESGVNRYTRRLSCLGRCTAAPFDHPNNVPPQPPKQEN